MPDSVITGTLTTLDQALVVGTQDNPLVGIEVSGTWAGTLNLETNLDPDNPLWRAAKVFTEAGATAPATITANGRWVVQAAIVGQVRARLNPATSGAVVVTLRAGDNETFGLGGGGGGGAVTGTVTVQEVAAAHGANPTAIAAGSPATPLTNRAGVPFVIGGHPNIQTIAFNFTTAQTDTALVTVATGLKIVVTGFLITCHNANTVNVAARLGFGTANTPAYGAAQLIGTHPGIAAGSGFGRGGGSGIIGTGADNEDLRLTHSVPTGGSVDCMVSWFTIES